MSCFKLTWWGARRRGRGVGWSLQVSVPTFDEKRFGHGCWWNRRESGAVPCKRWIGQVVTRLRVQVAKWCSLLRETPTAPSLVPNCLPDAARAFTKFEFSCKVATVASSIFIFSSSSVFWQFSSSLILLHWETWECIQASGKETLVVQAPGTTSNDCWWWWVDLRARE